jgi:heme oxygenase
MDLRWLGWTPVEIRSIPPCLDVPTVATIEQALGAMYFIEIVAKSVQALAGNLKKVSGFTRGEGANFFAGYARDANVFWEEFKPMFEHISNGKNLDEIGTAAASNFAALRQWLSTLQLSHAQTDLRATSPQLSKPQRP